MGVEQDVLLRVPGDHGDHISFFEVLGNGAEHCNQVLHGLTAHRTGQIKGKGQVEGAAFRVFNMGTLDADLQNIRTWHGLIRHHLGNDFDVSQVSRGIHHGVVI